MHVQDKKFGPIALEDGLQKDGLVDAYANQAMGVFADTCATKYNLLEKNKMLLRCNHTNALRTHGMMGNLIRRLFQLKFHNDEENQSL